LLLNKRGSTPSFEVLPSTYLYIPEKVHQIKERCNVTKKRGEPPKKGE